MKFTTKAALTLLFVLAAGTTLSQPVLSSRNMALGGGGTAYLTGVESGLMNPANLMLRTRKTDFSIAIGDAAYHFNPVSRIENPTGQVDHFLSYFKGYLPGPGPLSSDEIDALLARNYKNGRLYSEHQQRTELLLGGVRWIRGSQAFSLAARARMGSRFELGRGWYDESFARRSDSPTSFREMRLVQQSRFLYEFSFGYAQHFLFADGLIPRLGNLYIGIAPKFIIGGAYLNLDYKARYFADDPVIQTGLTQSTSYRSTGPYSDATQSYRIQGDAALAVARNFGSSFRRGIRNIPEPTGYGAGFDFGLTFDLPLGGDLQALSSDAIGTSDKSARLSFSVTDIGFVSYSDNSLNFDRQRDTTYTDPAGRAFSRYEGRPGEYLSFFSEADSTLDPFRSAPPGGTWKRSAFTMVLPTSFNAGLMLKINRISLMADLTLGLNDTAFNNTKLTGHFGLEFYPVNVIPIRIGTRLATRNPVLWSMGTGVETSRFDFSVGARFSTVSSPAGSEFAGGAFGGLRFHF